MRGMLQVVRVPKFYFFRPVLQLFARYYVIVVLWDSVGKFFVMIGALPQSLKSHMLNLPIQPFYIIVSSQADEDEEEGEEKEENKGKNWGRGKQRKHGRKEAFLLGTHWRCWVLLGPWLYDTCWLWKIYDHTNTYLCSCIKTASPKLFSKWSGAWFHHVEAALATTVFTGERQGPNNVGEPRVLNCLR